ncbi:MAG: hypothetical protein WC492_01950 [Candidatus Micrarchaeia archaeon]
MKTIISLFIVGIFLLSFGCLASKQTTETQPTTTQTPKCTTKTIQEPYYDQECDTVPYTDTECSQVNLKYTKGEIICNHEGLIGDWIVSSCSIANLDDEAGSFNAYAGVDINGQKNGEEQTAYIYPLQSHTFEYRVKASGSTCYCYETSIPTKQVCKDVIKYQQVCNTVTKYREVQKEECT